MSEYAISPTITILCDVSLESIILAAFAHQEHENFEFAYFWRQDDTRDCAYVLPRLQKLADHFNVPYRLYERPEMLPQNPLLKATQLGLSLLQDCKTRRIESIWTALTYTDVISVKQRQADCAAGEVFLSATNALFSTAQTTLDSSRDYVGTVTFEHPLFMHKLLSLAKLSRQVRAPMYLGASCEDPIHGRRACNICRGCRIQACLEHSCNLLTDTERMQQNALID
jgi:hypothetical protein